MSYTMNLFSAFFAIVLFTLLNLNMQCHAHHDENDTNKKSSDTLVDLLGVAENVIYSAKKYAKINTRSEPQLLYDKPMDCAEVLDKNASSKNGVYKVWPRNRIVEGPVTVYCHMEDEGGAWTVIQRRGDFDSSKDYFYRDWINYKNGFGDPMKDFWIGNDNIFALTNQRANTVKFNLRDWEGNHTYATYDNFWIDDENHNYTMHVYGYRGNAGDSFSYANNLPFTTKDKDHDQHDKNCAEMFKGAWWYGSCHSSNLNGQYLKGAHESYADGVEWSSFRGQHYSLMDAEIKIRPKSFVEKIKMDETPQ